MLIGWFTLHRARSPGAIAVLKKVMLVDDHAFLRDALAEVMVRAFPGVQVLQTGDLKGANALLALHRDVDLLLLDLQLPDGDGLEALAGLRIASGARLVVMSGDNQPDTIWRALEAGASGYLPKTLGSGDMLAAVKEVLQGGIFVPACAMAAIPCAAGPPELDGLGLSPRQTEVLSLLVKGEANKVIARVLGISEATIKSHISAILNRFGVATRTQVVVEMARRGWRVAHLRRPSG